MRGVGLGSGCIALGIRLLPFKGRELLLLWRGWEREGITNFFQHYLHCSSAFQRGKAHGFDLVSLDWFKPHRILVISQIRRTKVKVSLLMVYLYRVCPSLKDKPVHCLALPDCDFLLKCNCCVWGMFALAGHSAYSRLAQGQCACAPGLPCGSGQVEGLCCFVG